MNTVKEIAAPILKLALPLILIQLCQASLGLINTIIAGRYHYLDLAAIGLGSNIWAPVFIFCTGVLYVLVPKFAVYKQQQAGAQADALYQQAKKTAWLLAALGFVLIQILALFCPFFIYDAQVAKITQNYLHFVAFGIPGLIFMVLYRFISEGHSTLRPVVLTFFVLLICDAMLSAMLVNGWGPITAMGGSGSGLATAISAYFGCTVMRYLVSQNLPGIKISSAQQRMDTQAYTATFHDGIQLLKQGLPIGTALVLQILALAVLAFFVAQVGTKVIAAHQIVINIAMVIIMIPVAISSATTIRIAYFSAARNQQAKIQTGWTAAAITLLYGLLMSLLLVLFSKPITSLFTYDQAVLQIASDLIAYCAVFLFFDAFQTVASGVLRGLQQFFAPMLVILLSYWLLIIPLSYIVGVQGGLQLQSSAEIIWSILAAGIACAAVVMVMLSCRGILKHG